MLEIKNLEVEIGGSKILRGLSLNVNPGEVVCLMGRNGVGKSTTLKALMGLLPAKAGSIDWEGKSLLGRETADRARAGLGYVPQGREIFSYLTVQENLQLSLEVRGVKKAQAAEELAKVYELFPILKTFLHRKGGVLSGGQQQQLAIGRALLTDPRLLILDEPTEGIQPSIIQEIGDSLVRLKKSGKLAILLVEQYVDFARDCADRFYALDRGAVVYSGTIAELTDEVVKKHLQV